LKFRLTLLASAVALAALHAQNTVTTSSMTSDGVVYATGTTTVLANTTSTSGAGSGTPLASTIGSSASEYRINYYLYQTVAGVACTVDAMVTLNLDFTDLDSISRTASETLAMGNTNGSGSFLSGSLPIISAASSAISYTTTYAAGTGCSTAPKYGVYVWVEAM
jgi:hypothetical protein